MHRWPIAGIPSRECRLGTVAPPGWGRPVVGEADSLPRPRFSFGDTRGGPPFYLTSHGQVAEPMRLVGWLATRRSDIGSAIDSGVDTASQMSDTYARQRMIRPGSTPRRGDNSLGASSSSRRGSDNKTPVEIRAIHGSHCPRCDRTRTMTEHRSDTGLSQEACWKFRDMAPVVEFVCWVVVFLAPLLRWVNGPAVTDDQFVVQISIVSGALAGASGLRLHRLLLARRARSRSR